MNRNTYVVTLGMSAALSIKLSLSTIRTFNDLNFGLARACRREFAFCVTLPSRFFRDQCFDGMKVHRDTTLSTELGEILRINFDSLDVDATCDEISLVIRSIIPPFVEGLGDIDCRESEKGLIVFLTDDGYRHCGHGIRS
jgi:hypothetical protein